MATAPQSKVMTFEDVFALPDDGIERDLIRGELRERPRSMTKRNRWHSSTEAQVSRFLAEWLDARPEPRGLVVSGEAGFRLRRDPETGVGIDVAYVSADVVAATPDKSPFFEGPPVLAVEILSPSDRQEEIDEKIDLYREAGVSLIWIINPSLRTVLVLRPDAEPELFNVNQELTAEPHLPGFRVAVARLFR